MVLRKDELEIQLKDEHQLIKDGILKDDSPLDTSDAFRNLCQACRIGDLKGCQEAIAAGVNINARDHFDYTPLILASLCGHFQVVQLLLESGALCERDTFQGERCLYNALNDRIRNLLLQYDYSKSTNPLQPLASHITSLLTRSTPPTSDITLTAAAESWPLHKFILSARSPYFRKKLSGAPETAVWKLASSIPAEAFQIALRYLYLGDVPSDLGLTPKSSVTEEEVFKGIDKVSKQLEIESLWEGILSGGDRRIARQRHQDEVSRGRDQLEVWYRENVLRYKIEVDTSKAQDVKWTQDNSIFADVLLRADEDDYPSSEPSTPTTEIASTPSIPIGLPLTTQPTKPPRKSVLFPAHRAILLRSDYFSTMFSSSFVEALPPSQTNHLQIISVDCSPPVLKLVLDFLYTETVDIPLSLAVDVLFAADMLFIEKLKTKAAQVISTLGNGTKTSLGDRTHTDNREEAEEEINVYDVIRAGWDTRVQRLEEFSARYIAYRLEEYIDEEEFEELIKESAGRVKERQETDTIELLDDIRYYLSERFRLRFEDSGIEDMMDEETQPVIPPEDPSSLPPGQRGREEEVDEGIEVSPIGGYKSSENSGGEGRAGGAGAGIEGQIRTLNGEIAGDEFAADAINYEVLLEKIERLLERLKLDA